MLNTSSSCSTPSIDCPSSAEGMNAQHSGSWKLLQRIDTIFVYYGLQITVIVCASVWKECIQRHTCLFILLPSLLTRMNIAKALNECTPRQSCTHGVSNEESLKKTVMHAVSSVLLLQNYLPYSISFFHDVS